ncbi:MAG: hypothetical protein WCO26_24110 [Deltaproteobacteria bacterium]
MNLKIWRWHLKYLDEQTLVMPGGAQLLSVQIGRGGTPCLWALCDTDSPDESRTILFYGTGNPIPEKPGRYLGTFQLGEGQLVFHVFEEAWPER